MIGLPAKPSSEKSNSTENKGKQVKIEAKKKPLSVEIRADGDSNVSAIKQVLKANPSGDHKTESAEIKDTFKPEDIPESGDNVKTSILKEQKIADKNDGLEGDHVKAKQLSTTASEKKVIKKKTKTKTEFSVTPATDIQKNDENKNNAKEKKKNENKSVVQKPKKVKEKKEPKEPKVTLPVRSLTDEEYTAIFDATIENAMNLNIDEWAPKATSPSKKKEPVKKKYSITVGKKEKKTEVSTQESCPRPSTGMIENTEGDDKEHEVLFGLDNSEIEDNVPQEAKNDKAETEKQGEDGDIDSKEENEDKEIHTNEHGNEDSCNEIKDNNSQESDNAEKENASEEEVNGDRQELVDENNNDLEDNGNRSDANEEEIVVDDIQDEPVEERAQDENETTPVGSEVDAEEGHSKCIIPPVKKKKISKVNKNPKLEPKQLPFEKPKEVSMVEKVIQIKKQKLDSHKLPAKKRKLYDEVKKHGAENAGKKALQEAGKKKKPEKKISKKQKMQERELEINGTWVQCCNSTCMKWRYLSDVSDPTIVPERWTCSMNTNKNYNSCEKAEENYDESEHIYTKFAEGSVVWARMTGYPWWPAMVEIDPDTETFFSIDSDDSMIPTHYHVVFFDEHVSRTWVKADYLKMFTGNEDDDGIVYQISKKGQSYKKEIGVAKKNAMRARSCTIQERIELFGFASRYKGPWSSKSKGNKVEKRKSSKTVSGQESKVEQVNFLDEDTMDDVLEHTDALLDNVEEMLDSINSQLDDSDADSDFMPEELIVVETKKKRVRKSSVSSPGKIEKASKKKVNFMEANIEADMGTDTNSIECDKEVSKTKRNSKIKADINETLSKSVDTSLKLDSDIFTMEMYTQNDDITKTVGNTVEEKTNETKDNKTEERVQESVPKVKGKSTKRKKAENSDCNQDRMKAKKQKENKSELVTLLTETDSEEKLENQVKSCKQNENLEEVTDTENTKLSNDSTEKNLGDKTEQDKTELGTGTDSIKSNTDSHVKNEVTEKGNQKEQNSNSEETIVRNDEKTKGNTVDRSPIIRELGNEKEVQNLVGLDDEIDLSAIESDAVPDIDREEINAGSTRSTEQNLDNESDSEFDLEEHYMYETVTDGSDKVREKGVVNVPAHVAEVDEDSDPFDLMEE